MRDGALAPAESNDAAPRASTLFDRAPHAERVSPLAPTVASPVAVPVADRKIVVSDAGPAHRPIPAGETLEERERTKFLSSTTEVSADRVTLYVPRAMAGEVSREGATVARLRRLTVRAVRLSIVVRDGNPDVQLTARGSVSLRSDQPASVIEESGLKSLLLKNDGYTPLR